MERSEREHEDDDATSSMAVQAKVGAGASEHDGDMGGDDGPVVQAKAEVGDAGNAGSWDADAGLMSAMGLGGDVQMLEAEGSAPVAFEGSASAGIATGEPGKTSLGGAVQMRPAKRIRQRRPEDVQQAAAEGVAGSGGELPHLDKIQQSFGAHDVSGVRAHTGAQAQQATETMGAEAYATNANGTGDVAFSSGSPSLHTAAHEAAHVVQQRGGVQLKGGVGQVGDAYEQHADAVADAVVQGKSAEPILDQMAPSGGAGGGAVQGKFVQLDIKADLKKAMDGWGTDEDAIFARIERATVPELQSVLADPALMSELRSELDQGDMERVLDGLRAPLADKLRLGLEGWFSADADYIHRALLQASPADLATVAADQALVNKLQKRLSGDDLRSVFDRLQLPLARKLQYAIAGWGTDEAYIYSSVEKATAADCVAVANNAALVAQVDDDLSGAELDRWRGTLAKRCHEGGQDIVAFRMCMGSSDDQRRRRLVYLGDVTVQRAVCDTVILTSTNANEVRSAFQSYWEVELTVTAGATTWPIATLQAMHNELKVIPSQDTRSRVWKELQLTSDPALINRAAYGGGVFSVGSNASTTSTISMGYGTQLAAAAKTGDVSITVNENRFKVGDTVVLDNGNAAKQENVTISAIAGTTYTVSALTKDHDASSYVGASGGGGLRDVNWLTATVRHEIAHSVESIVDTSGFKQGIGGWWSGDSFDAWANAMGNPWGSATISDDDKKQIKSTIEDYVHNAKGTLTALPADNAVIKHWADNVPVIQAAEACLSRGDNFFASPTALYQTGGKVFTCSAWYKVFQYCNTGVLTDRLSDYTLYAAAEFFAETYTVFYEEASTGATDAQLGRHVRNPAWAAWIRSNIHERGHAPAPPAGGAGGPAGPGATPQAAGGGGTPGQAPAGDGRPGGASHGKKAHNPN